MIVSRIVKIFSVVTLLFASSLIIAAVTDNSSNLIKSSRNLNNIAISNYNKAVENLNLDSMIDEISTSDLKIIVAKKN